MRTSAKAATLAKAAMVMIAISFFIKISLSTTRHRGFKSDQAFVGDFVPIAE
jgi:hypothetical protein